MEELKNYMYLPEDITNFINKLIKIEIKIRTYEEILKIGARDDLLAREIMNLCRSSLLDTLIWARLVLPPQNFKEYKERVDRIINEIDKSTTKTIKDMTLDVYTFTVLNILDALKYAKMKVYPMLIREIINNLDTSLVRREKEEEEGLRIRRRI
ncbi:MAG TPA: hypothetical protein ENG63_04115 [Candidatus Desulfofervidus auxilii]|uniref:DUF86 domain-containing protein n=1 Tax=Desulfofervidus auxilii TaxID=1621989 RepID=A0A7C0Y919_DESA2|nr:hypothetical protein [Candidatus Desulfofervidus auxilii]